MSQLFETKPVDTTIVRYAHVALEQGIDQSPEGLTYGVPEALADLAVGERVSVPLGKRNKATSGYIVGFSDATDVPAGKIKPILGRDASGVALTADLVQLARWIAQYYCCPLGMVLVTMLPAAVKHGTGKVMRRVVRFVTDEPPQPDEPAGKKRTRVTKLQRAVLEAAKARAVADDHWIDIHDLADEAGAKTVTPVRQLIEKGMLEEKLESAVRATLAAAGLASTEAQIDDLALSQAQQDTLASLVRATRAGFSVHLVHGVTGSGKTEVYLRLIDQLGDGEDAKTRPGAIVLVPEIALTPQTVGRFVRRFGEANVAVLHSGLTASQRHQYWRRIREGQARIVVGARSAIFAPVPRLGVIIVDEEHEQTYKQDQLPRYHARDVAIRRGQLLNIPVILGSATPSLESYHNAIAPMEDETDEADGREHRPHYTLHRLPDRVTGFTLPRVRIVDMVSQRRARYEYTGKAGIHLLSLPLEAALRRTFEAGRQAMLLLNRRGYANYIACPDQTCGWIMMCDACDALMVYHKDRRLPTGGFVRCHHCNAEQLLPATCPTCGKKVVTFGLGTQRVEEEIERKMPSVAYVRMDSDTMRTAADYQDSLEAFRRGEIQLLLGTQMIAKGLDFPNVRLVGVISADTSLHLPDFRAAERTFQLIAQVAGRAGRGDEPGEVLVQTFNPDDPTIALAARHDYEAFARRELDVRASAGLPPVARMVRIVVRDKNHVNCLDHARSLADLLQQVETEHGLAVRLRGPAPCPIARVADFHRQQIELIAQPPGAAGRLQRLLTIARNKGRLRADARTAIDVDPVSLL